MSHELRTPLHAIIGFSELIHAQAAGSIDASYVAWAGDILSGGRHLLDMINGLLDLSRIEAGRYDLSEESFDLARIVHACVELIRLQAEAKQVSVDCVIEETVITGGSSGDETNRAEPAQQRREVHAGRRRCVDP